METVNRTAHSRPDAAEAEMKAVMAAYEQPLLRYAASILPNPHAAKDAVQQAFIRLCAFGFPLPFDPPALRAWLYRTTWNTAIDLLRAEKRRAVLHEKAAEMIRPSPSLPSPHPTSNDPRLEQLQPALARLSEPERQIVLLRLQQNLSYKEIGTITGRPIGSVGRLLHQAIQKLSRLVQSHSTESSP